MGYTGQQKRDYQNEWMRKRRQAWIDSRGARCEQCGRDDLPFEVDHVDRTTKVSHRVWSWSKERMDKELDKCQLLCNDCHRKKTGKENATGRNHGETLYRDGCRCEICKKEHNGRKQKRRAERKALGLPHQ